MDSAGGLGEEEAAGVFSCVTAATAWLNTPKTDALATPLLDVAADNELLPPTTSCLRMVGGGGEGGGVAVVNDEDVFGDGAEPPGEPEDLLIPSLGPEESPAALASDEESTASLDAVVDLALESSAAAEELLSSADEGVSVPTAFFDWASFSLESGSRSTAGALLKGFEVTAEPSIDGLSLNLVSDC